MPSAALTAAFLLALVPGWVYLRLRSGKNAALPRGGLDEVLEVVAIGVATTGVAAALWALLPVGLTHLADVRELAANRQGYVDAHVRRVAATGLTIFLLALGLAFFLFRLAHRGPRPALVRETVWAGALGRRGDHYAWVGLTLRDGRLVEGELFAYPVGDEHEHRDVALQAPIRVTPPGGGPAVVTPLSRVILNEADIEHIGLVLGPLRGQPGVGVDTA